MNWYLDVFADDREIEARRERDRRSGPCEDDCETTAPYIGLLPDETEHEEPSPLEFGAKQGRGPNIGFRFVSRR